MSKKLIAVAAAAALALTGLVGVAPASANMTIAVTGNAATPTGQTASDGIAATTAFSVNVPSADVIRTNQMTPSGNTSSTALRLVVTKATADSSVTVSVTGGVRVFTAAGFADSPTVAKSLTTITDTSNSATVDIYVITTSTAAGTVVVSNAGNSRTIFVKGLSVQPYKLVLTGPTSAALGGEFTISGKVQDAFGNDLTTAMDPASTSDFTVTTVGATAVAAKTIYTTATRTYSWVFTAPTTASGTAVNIAVVAAKASGTITAFGAPVNSQFFSVNAVNLAAQVTALEAQVAALKADYNKLVERWNKRVDSRKAPKKKVALK